MARPRTWGAAEEHTAAQNTHAFGEFHAAVRQRHFPEAVVLNLLRACRIPEQADKPRTHFSIGRMLRLTTDLRQGRATFAGVDRRLLDTMQHYVNQELEVSPSPSVFEPARGLLDTVLWDDGRTSEMVTLSSWSRFVAHRRANAAKVPALKQDFRNVLQYGAWGVQGGVQNIAISAPGLTYDSRWALSPETFAQVSTHVVMYNTALPRQLDATAITETGMYGAAIRTFLAESAADQP